MPFRYSIQPAAKVNVFEPKQLVGETTRASMIAAAMMTVGFSKFPLRGEIVQQLWEACSILLFSHGGSSNKVTVEELFCCLDCRSASRPGCHR